jgi:hypothetical protein
MVAALHIATVLGFPLPFVAIASARGAATRMQPVRSARRPGMHR